MQRGDSVIPEENIIVLSDEKGNGIQLEYLDTIEYEGHSYVVMTQEDCDEVIIMEQTVNTTAKAQPTVMCSMTRL